MLLFSLGSLVVFLWPAYWPLGLALVVTSVAKVIYDPAMQAYLGDVVPYQKRGAAVGVTEFSWAGALLLGAPLIGLVMAREGWQAPFLWLALLGMVAAGLLWRALPSGRVAITGAASWRAVAQVIRDYPVIWAAVIYVLLVMAANELLLIVYGEWMERSFDLSLTNLGLASGVIGGAEIVGELVVALSVDRLGKRPVVIAGGLCTSVLYLVIPYASFTLPAALLTLFAVFLAFEITVVGAVPLLTEVVPSARSVVLSAVLAGGSLGRMWGALIGPVVWRLGGLPGNTGLGALVTLVGILVLARWVREGVSEPVSALGSD
jgi:predicted MFS family arabinose efflux permease